MAKYSTVRTDLQLSLSRSSYEFYGVIGVGYYSAQDFLIHLMRELLSLSTQIITSPNSLLNITGICN